MEEIHQKMEALEGSQHFSHYKSMEIFPDTQGQLTLQPEVCSGRMLNPSKILWLSFLSARMKNIQSKKKIQSNIKGIEWLKDYPLIFQMLKGS